MHVFSPDRKIRPGPAGVGLVTNMKKNLDQPSQGSKKPPSYSGSPLRSGHRSEAAGTPRRGLRLAWLLIPLFLGLILLLWKLDIQVIYEPPYLLPVLNFIFSTTISLFVAWLAARSYHASGFPPVLFLGCGMLLLGITSLAGGIAIHFQHFNTGITIYNIGIWCSGLCHFMGAVTALAARERMIRSTDISLTGAYAIILGLIALVVLIAFERMTPLFFVQGLGPTPMRQAIMGSGTGLFAMAAVILRVVRRRSPSVFLYWYSLSLGLIACGMFGVLIIRTVGSPLGWAGRTAQYAGCVYMLVAAVTAVRESGGWGIALQEALRESEQRFQQLADAMPQLVWTANPDGMVDYYNRRHREFRGITSTAPGKWEWMPVVYPDDAETTFTAWQEAVRTGNIYQIEHRIQREDGSWRWYLSRAVPARDDEGNIVKWFGTATEIEEQKQAEAALEQARDELEQRVAERTAELTASNTELELRTRQLARLASELTLVEQRERRRMAYILHDHLQQLLASVRYSLDILVRRTGEEKQTVLKQLKGSIDEAIQTSRSLTVELSPPILHDAGLIAGLQWLVRWLKEHHGLTVDLKTDPEADTDREDLKILLFQSVRELLFNVVQHAGSDHARVELTRYDDSILRVVVQDTGTGFDPEEMWSRASSSDGGFGLFSIRERLEYLGGSMVIESTPQSSTSIRLTVPARVSLEEQDETPQMANTTAAPAQKAPETKERNIRVLIADDHAVMREGLALILDEPDIEIVGEASDGQEAVEKAAAIQPDIILMDFSMPRMDGVAATRAIHERFPSIPIIGLSMFEESDRGAAMRNAGAVAYLSKSGNSDTLLTAVRKNARSRPATGAGVS